MLHLFLLVSCSLVSYTLGQSAKAASVQDVRDNYRNFMEATLVDIPFDACKAECQTNSDCVEAVYWKGYHISDLCWTFVINKAGYEIPQSLLLKVLTFSRDVPWYLMTCHKCTVNQRCNKYYGGQQTCRNGCGSPIKRLMLSPTAGANQYSYEGNMFNFGNRATVYCKQDRTKHQVVTCQDDSTWTTLTLQCPTYGEL